MRVEQPEDDQKCWNCGHYRSEHSPVYPHGFYSKTIKCEAFLESDLMVTDYVSPSSQCPNCKSVGYIHMIQILDQGRLIHVFDCLYCGYLDTGPEPADTFHITPADNKMLKAMHISPI